MPPYLFSDFLKSIVAVSLFLSNILFWQESGYFNEAAELKPLLHTWSLAIEEQYYVLFPPFLMLVWSFARRFIIPILVLVAVTSLLIAQWGTQNDPSATFFLLPTRGWELLAGGLVAFYLFHKEDLRGSQTLSLLGFFMILYSVLVFDGQTPFPGFYALVPTLGVVCIILFTSVETLVYRLLSSKILVGVGLVSYSAYLWHQPLFAFARHLSRFEPSNNLMIGLIVMVIPLSYLSWRFVEKPFRNRNTISRKTIFSLTALVSLTFAVTGLVWTQTIDGALAEATHKAPSLRFDCMLVGSNQAHHRKTCYAKANEQILLWGDSHAASLYPGLKNYADQGDIGLTALTQNGCPPIFDIRKLTFRKNCNVINANIFQYIKEKKTPLIVLHASWQHRDYPMTLPELYESLSSTLRKIKQANPESKILVVSNVPRWHINAIHEYNFAVNDLELNPPGQNSEEALLGVAEIFPELNSTVQKAAEMNDVYFIAPTHLMCDPDPNKAEHATCILSLDGSLAGLTAVDEAHLAPLAAIYLTEQMSAVLDDLLSQ